MITAAEAREITFLNYDIMNRIENTIKSASRNGFTSVIVCENLENKLLTELDSLGYKVVRMDNRVYPDNLINKYLYEIGW
jgi:hypothetical protein